MPRFDVYVPQDLNDALSFLDERGEEAIPLAGGTDLLTLIRAGVVKPKILLDLWPLRKNLSYIRREGGYVRIGALTTVDEVLANYLFRDSRYLGFIDAARGLGPTFLRSIATIGGNVATGHPLSDMAILLLALKAEVKFVSRHGERRVSIDEIYLDKRKIDRRPNELIAEVAFREKPMSSSTAVLKIDRRRGHSMGYVVSASYMALEGDVITDVGIAFDSLGKPYPGRAYRTEEFLIGRRFSEDTIAESSKVLELEMTRLSDYRAPAEYRLSLSKTLLKKCLLLVSQRIKEELMHG
ncbi:MAG: FAD binding domain-containing protein [Sulfolobales archaeon]|nr:FAD binding domain-containing protein [Sulfolobales archaeon]MCX8198721.1 FAD binding domain-containing protein [Sulfolobales archaeon]MDW8169794.1 FAD binding domain-containing protein [Desulfurococcaceae archaeon]